MTESYTSAKAYATTGLPGPRLLEALGTLFTVAASVETAIAFQIARIASSPNHISVPVLPLTVGAELRVKLGHLRRLIGITKPKHRKAVSQICDDIQGAFEPRNTLAHSVVIPGRAADELEVRGTKFSGKGVLPDPECFSLEQIYKFAADIKAAGVKLDKTLTQIGFPPLREWPEPTQQ